MPDVVEWRYLRLGSCDSCPHEKIRVRTPSNIAFHTVSPPAFCARCQKTFEERWRARGEQTPEQVLDAMKRFT